jgi:hypothetical protein
VRNPCSNLRFVPIINPVIHPKQIRWVGNCVTPSKALKAFWAAGGTTGPWYWTFTTQGLYAGFACKKPTGPDTAHRFQIGWKIYPDDAGRDEGDFVGTSRYPRCGFGIQFTLNRKGG